MSDFNERIAAVREINGSVPKFIREALDEFRTEKAKITADRNLSFEGRQEATKKLQAKYEEGFLLEMKKKDEEKHSLLDEAKAVAEKVFTAALPPVDDTQLKLFDMTLKSVEAKVNFALGTNQAMDALDSLVQAASEPLLAQKVLDKFIAISTPALSLAAATERAALKQRLGSLYDQLEARAQVEGAQEARAALQTINAMKGAGYASGYVRDALKEISKKTADYVNNPKSYFENK